MMSDESHINADGTKRWYLNGQRHREDGPAIEFANGDKMWFLDGKQHRTDGPAMEWASGDKSWYLYDQRHRTDGPAAEYTNGTKSWYLNGRYYTFNRWLEANTELSDQQRVMFKLEHA
jgi:hypothetical protein